MTAKEKRDNESEVLTDSEPVKIKPKRTAKVTETKRTTYDAEIESGENDFSNQIDDDENTPVIPFSAFFQSDTSNVKQNTLAHFLTVLSESDETSFLISLERMVDLPTDEFNKPCQFSPINFPPFHFAVENAPSFIAMIQKMNGQSGGRFNISAFSHNGQPIYRTVSNNFAPRKEYATLKGFAVSNPMIISDEHSNNNSNMQMFEMFREMLAKQDEKFAQMLEALKPKESEFDTLAKELLKKKLLEPEKPSEDFNPNKVIEQVFTSQLMIQQMSESLAKGFNNQTDEMPTWMKFLESQAGQAVIEKAGTTLNGLAMLAASRLQQPQTNANGQTITVNPEQSAPKILSPEEQKREQEQLSINMQNLIDDIIAELETENPLNAENETFLMLKEQYPQVLPMLIGACKSQPFEQVTMFLEQIVPDTFAEYKKVNERGQAEYNEKGQKLIKRLNEFYEFLKTQ